MPTYEYSCSKCGHEFECQQSMSAPPLTTCPKDLCPRKPWGKGKVKRGVGGGAGLIFKGSGFYITDYRSEGYKSAAKKDSTSPAPKADSKSSESKPTAKPAAKSDSK
ncbi:MAG: zinc ribbon domain-containing protein [Verrucomicrobia bacterium]|nr:zinc ribbon domain-containing protein [Verrucomicrobiota bacterium]